MNSGKSSEPGVEDVISRIEFEAVLLRLFKGKFSKDTIIKLKENLRNVKHRPTPQADQPQRSQRCPSCQRRKDTLGSKLTVSHLNIK